MPKFDELILNFLNIENPDLKLKLEEVIQDLKAEEPSSGENTLLSPVATNRLLILTLMNKVKTLEHLNVIKDLQFPDIAPTSVTSKLSISADYPLPAEQGFYELEYDLNGKVMRWTGPSQTFFFDLCFDRTQEKELILKILSPLSEKNLSETRCFVDSHEILLQKTKQDGINELKGTLPAKGNFGTTKISFKTPEIISPSAKNPQSEDKRVLGVAFYELIIH